MIRNVCSKFKACFGRTHYSRIIGWTIPIVTVISAGGSILAGFL